MYEQAIGIPDVNWGSIDPYTVQAPEPPTNWSGQVEGFYYIDPDAPNATDDGNPYGSPDMPRATVPKTVPAGSYIEMHGTYPEGRTYHTFQGTEENPIWIRGDGSGDLQHMGAMDFRNSSYLMMENLDFSGGSGGAISIADSGHHIMIRDSAIHDRDYGGSSQGIGIKPHLGEHIHDIVIHNNTFERLGDWTTTEDQDFHGINPGIDGRDSSTFLSDIWITNNYFENLSGDGVQVNAGHWEGSEHNLHHVYIGHNEAYQNRQQGFWVKQASDVIISQNKAHGMYGSGNSSGGGGFGSHYEKDNVWFIFNESYDNAYGFRQAGDELNGDAFYIGNLVHNIRPNPNGGSYDPNNAWSSGTAFAFYAGVSDGGHRYVIDNTVYNAYDGIAAIRSGHLETHGNLITGITDNTGRFLYIEHPGEQGDADMDYNLYMDNEEVGFRGRWDPSNQIIADLSELQMVSGQAQNSQLLKGDSSSLYVATDENNFALVKDSAAASGSVKHWAYDFFKQRYGIDIDVDFNGNARPTSGRSFGAFEDVDDANGGGDPGNGGGDPGNGGGDPGNGGGDPGNGGGDPGNGGGDPGNGGGDPGNGGGDPGNGGGDPGNGGGDPGNGGGMNTVVRTDTAGAYDWHKITTVYTDAGDLVSRVILYDNGDKRTNSYQDGGLTSVLEEGASDSFNWVAEAMQSDTQEGLAEASYDYGNEEQSIAADESALTAEPEQTETYVEDSFDLML